MKREVLQALVRDIFAAAGMSAEHAALVADVLVWADRRGMGSHGVMRVGRYVGLIRKGELNPVPRLKIIQDTPACVLIDADHAAGPVAMVHAMRAAMAKARTAGIGLALVRETTHTAALGYYTQMAAREGLAGIAMSASIALMAYHGARAAGVSTAPLSIAVPGEDEPVALDMGSGVVSMGKLMQARRSGEPLAPGLALDAQGRPTTDAKQAEIPLPLGGPKGSGLALMIECLASLIAASPILAQKESRAHQNGLLIAIDVARFTPLEVFKGEVTRLATMIKSLPAEGEILLPGERGHRNARSDEVKISAKVLEELQGLARQ